MSITTTTSIDFPPFEGQLPAFKPREKTTTSIDFIPIGREFETTIKDKYFLPIVRKFSKEEMVKIMKYTQAKIRHSLMGRVRNSETPTEDRIMYMDLIRYKIKNNE
jgi:hypothetical protein